MSDGLYFVTMRAVYPVERETKHRYYVGTPIAGWNFKQVWFDKQNGFAVVGAGPAQDFFVRWQKLREERRRAGSLLHENFLKMLGELLDRYKVENREHHGNRFDVRYG